MVLTKHDLAFLAQGTTKKETATVDDSEIVALYAKGVSVNKMVFDFGITADRIKAILNRNGVLIRTQKESMQLLKQARQRAS